MILANCRRSAYFLPDCLPVGCGGVGKDLGKVRRAEERVEKVFVRLILIFFFYLASQRISEQTNILFLIKNRPIEPLNLSQTTPFFISSLFPKLKSRRCHPHQNRTRKESYLSLEVG